ncbi:UbiA prenyltransferase family protein [Helicobacter aurati]|uniref:phosphoribose diphosphate--decaprenyl-phosphate phosphoribosyltransferase n=1 Tax=Helicobacter aurati TaxID=137778 RepID=UPI000CF16202|nr:phosphoribose diphosphate--decaprenyl-phosphate phosphoribosyltransferase [Helicobacter aurati]
MPNAIFIFLPICVYVFLNIAYTLKLKHIAIVDICVIATGFVLRLFIGSFAAQVALSHWIIVITFCLSLFLALAKRRGEWQVSHTMRPCLQDYNLPFFDCALGVLAAIILIAYILYSIDSSVTIRMQTSSLYLTSIFVLLGILRYLQLTFVMNKTEDPSKVVLKDRFLQIVISLWIISFFVLLYL